MIATGNKSRKYLNDTHSSTSWLLDRLQTLHHRQEDPANTTSIVFEDSDQAASINASLIQKYDYDLDKLIAA